MTNQSAFPQRQTMLERQAESRRLSAQQKPSAHWRKRRWLISAAILILFVLAACYHYLIYLPQPDMPHRLTLLDDVFAFGVVGLVGLVGLILGRRLLRPFPLAAFSRLERGILAIGLGWGLVSLSVLAVGLAHLLYTWLLIVGLGWSWQCSGAIPGIFWLRSPLAHRTRGYARLRRVAFFSGHWPQ